MKKIILLAVILSMAQTPVPYSHEVVTFTGAAGGIGFSAATLTVNGRQMQTCSGVLETAAIRLYYDGTAPTASDGIPLAVGQFFKLDGFTALTNLRGIRITGTSGVIRFTCGR